MINQIHLRVDNMSLSNEKSVQKSVKSTVLSGWLNGLLGVIIFSGSLPATKLVVTELNPFFLTFSRASIAGLLGLLLLLIFREKSPQKSQILSLIIVSIGVVIGFPLLTAIALQYVSSSHSIVFLGLLPLVTAIFAVLRGGESPKPIFWLFSIIGSSLVAGYAISKGASTASVGDILMVVAVILCGMGYAEGAKLTKSLGGWQVISWSLVISLPIMLIATYLTKPNTLTEIHLSSWLSLGYVSIFSMLVGFIFWYKGLAQGGTAVVGQLQLLQPFFGLALSALLLGEMIDPVIVIVTFLVILCVYGSKRFSR